jgi:hypothetical protein
VSRTRTCAVMGLFHVHESETPIRDSYSPKECPDCTAAEVAVYAHRAQSFEVLSRKDKRKLELDSMGSEILTLAPVSDGFACLGLLDKYNGSAAIESFEVLGGKTGKIAFARLREGGRIGFYAKRKPKTLTVNGKKARFERDRRTGFVVVATKIEGPVTVVVTCA